MHTVWIQNRQEFDDQLFAMSKHFPGMLDEVDGLSAFIGILVDEKTIVIHIV